MKPNVDNASANALSPSIATRCRVFLIASAAFLLLWLAFPPIGWWWLGWIGAVPLVWLILIDRLPAKSPYRQLYVAGFFYWLALFYFVRIPHWLLNFGWLTLAAYLAIYTPLLVSVSRTLIHTLRVPAIVAVPIVWTGVEWMRSNFFTGLAIGCLAHSQYEQPVLIQVADLSGAYTLGFAMMVFTTGLTVAAVRFLGNEKRLAAGAASLVVAMIALAAVIGYGRFRLNEPIEYRSDASIDVALIQSSIDVVFRPLTEDEMTERWEQHRDLTLLARKQWPKLELIIWPESGFQSPDLLSDVDDELTVEYFATASQQLHRTVTGFPRQFESPVSLLTGIGTSDPANQQNFNTAAMFSTDGIITERYYKGHRVLFGEYVPLAEQFPIVAAMTPIGKGISAGSEFRVFDFSGLKIAPNVCFESVVPHYIRRQVNSLSADGNEPDVLINLTNDGWFFGTSCLDLHLASNVFRAVEMRKPVLVCANTGFSAEIDTCGRVLQQGPRRDKAVLKATVRPIVRNSLYRKIGDIIPMVFGWGTLLIGLWGWRDHRGAS